MGSDHLHDPVDLWLGFVSPVRCSFGVEPSKARTVRFRSVSCRKRWEHGRLCQNSDSRLDPEISRLAGSSDHIIRAYTDSTTGEVATVLVLYGLADSVFGHTPEICYNAAGYKVVSPPADRQFALSDSSTPVQYRGFYVARQGVASTEYSEVIWSFWHAGSWWPDVSSTLEVVQVLSRDVQNSDPAISVGDFRSKTSRANRFS